MYVSPSEPPEPARRSSRSRLLTPPGPLRLPELVENDIPALIPIEHFVTEMQHRRQHHLQGQALQGHTIIYIVGAGYGYRNLPTYTPSGRVIAVEDVEIVD